MRHAHFLVLTGRLNEFPLHELVETLRGQRKTGRLQVEFKAGPAALYFRDGALVDARMGSLRGLEALSLALSLQHEDAAAFNFNPLVAPPDAPHHGAEPEREAAPREEFVAQPRPHVIEVEPTSAAEPPPVSTAASLSGSNAASLPSAPETAPRALPPAPDDVLLEKLNRIEGAVAAQARRANVERAAYALVIALLVVAGLFWRGRDAAPSEVRPEKSNAVSANAQGPRITADGIAPAGASTAAAQAPSTTADAASGASANDPAQATTTNDPARGATTNEPARASETATARGAMRANTARTSQEASASAPRTDAATARTSQETSRARTHVVQVRMTVERGRVLRAEVSNPRPGMSAYEALALRMARQRRFPEQFSGQETLRLRVEQ
jgi:hypothetical protein